jgi:hypothetical protein
MPIAGVLVTFKDAKVAKITPHDPTAWLSELVAERPHISQGIATLTEILSRT